VSSRLIYGFTAIVYKQAEEDVNYDIFHLRRLYHTSAEAVHALRNCKEAVIESLVWNQCRQYYNEETGCDFQSSAFDDMITELDQFAQQIDKKVRETCADDSSVWDYSEYKTFEDVVVRLYSIVVCEEGEISLSCKIGKHSEGMVMNIGSEFLWGSTPLNLRQGRT